MSESQAIEVGLVNRNECAICDVDIHAGIKFVCSECNAVVCAMCFYEDTELCSGCDDSGDVQDDDDFDEEDDLDDEDDDFDDDIDDEDDDPDIWDDDLDDDDDSEAVIFDPEAVNDEDDDDL